MTNEYGFEIPLVSEEECKLQERIEELENKIADIKANCDLAIEGRDIKIKELEKENAELKEINSETLTQLNLDNGELIIENEKLRKENAELDMKRKAERKIFQGIVEKKNDQLTKAKEIIKDQKELLDRVLSGAETLSDFAQDTLRKAEQYLKGENIILEDAQAGNSPFDADEVFNKEMKAYPEEK